MGIMIVYILIVVVFEAAVVGIGLTLDGFYRAASLPISLTLFFAVLWLAWVFAARLTKPKEEPKISDADPGPANSG